MEWTGGPGFGTAGPRSLGVRTDVAKSRNASPLAGWKYSPISWLVRLS
jgi:hypothetical protein